MLKAYYYLTKPGIIRGNAVNTLAGFFLASTVKYDFKLFFLVLVGVSLIVASACVFNNVLDAKIDAQMERTKKRAMAMGLIPKTHAVIFGLVLFGLGFLDLYLFTNYYALIAALIGFVVYVFLYTNLKPKSEYATLIGAVSGSMPPLGGYLAVANNLDAGAVILFFIYTFWQMPHFYAIGIYRFQDYAAAHLPIWPVKFGIQSAKKHILFHMLAFAICVSLLTFYGYTGYIYLTVMLLLALYWLVLGIKGFTIDDNIKWAKKIFKISLIIVLVFCLIIPIDKLIK